MNVSKPISHLRRAVPWLWLALSALWAVVIIVTDTISWPLALWIATTVGPLTYLYTSPAHDARTRDRSNNESSRNTTRRGCNAKPD